MAAGQIPRTLLAELIRTLKRRGVDYADVRYEQVLHESVVVEDNKVKAISLTESAGVGIRVLIGGSWGFAATPHLSTRALTRALTQALEIAKASASINKRPLRLAPVEPRKAIHRSSWRVAWPGQSASTRPERARKWAPTITFSSAVMPAKQRRF